MENPEKDGVPVENASILNNSADYPGDYFLGEPENITELTQGETIDPIRLRFVPISSWTSKQVSLSYLEETYFSRKNNVNRRFEHKLWNALQITKAFPNLISQVGVVWISNTIFKVYKSIFARLLHIRCINGGLFHKQGNFTCHGFVVLTESEISSSKIFQNSLLLDVDYRNVVCVAHKNRSFTMDAPESTISECKWDNPVPQSRIATLKIDNSLMPSSVYSMDTNLVLQSPGQMSPQDLIPSVGNDSLDPRDPKTDI